MTISIDQIKELRNKTGAGMADCKKALEDSDGNIEKAIEILRKKGAALATKRADKSTNEGAIKSKISDDKKSAAIIEVNCETDFVSKGEAFQEFSDNVAEATLLAKSNDINTVLETKIGELTIKERLDSLMAAAAEKTEIKRVCYLHIEDGFFGDYNHFGSKLGSLVGAKGEYTEEAGDILNKIAMQVVAMNPIAIKREDVPAEIIEKEKEIYTSQVKNEGKPENIIDKIVQNKTEKYFQENVLLEQEFIQDSKIAVMDFIADYKEKTGKSFEITEMVRYQLG